MSKNKKPLTIEEIKLLIKKMEDAKQHIPGAKIKS